MVFLFDFSSNQPHNKAYNINNHFKNFAYVINRRREQYFTDISQLYKTWFKMAGSHDPHISSFIGKAPDHYAQAHGYDFC